ncbi:hypothetical protein EV426DRAFT_584311 [Tirmania nivea]|nr:hypothetical protein EV426DRAFT_584311 [Tirmania nivea]
MACRARSSPVLPTRKPVNAGEVDTDQIAMQRLHEFTHSEDKIRNSSLDAFASSVTVGEDNSDDGQWIDMILNEYYWGGAKDNSNIDPNGKVQEQHGVVEEGSFTKLLGDMELLFDPVKGITTSEREDNSWRDIGLQNGAMGEIFEHSTLLPTLQAERTMANEITIPEGKPQTTIEHKIGIDLDDDKAWRDFVHQPPVKEDWGEQNEESSFEDLNCKRRKRFRSLYLGESEDDYIFPLRKKNQIVVEIPSNSGSGDEGSSDSGHLAIDAQSNAATVGTRLSSSISSSVPASENNGEVDLECSVLGNISSLSNGNIDNGDGCSSVVANVSSSSLATRLPVSDSVETESTESTKHSSPSKGGISPYGVKRKRSCGEKMLRKRRVP